MSNEASRLLGTIQSDGDIWVLRIEDWSDSTMDDVWRALTDPARLARWIGEVQGDLRVDGEYRRRFFASGSEGTGRIEACEPPGRLVVRHFAERGDEHLIKVTLDAEGEGTRVVVEVLELPPEKLFAYGAGIQIHVEDLVAYLEGREVEDADPRWDTLLARYEELVRQAGTVTAG